MIAEFTIIPMGKGVSVSHYVGKAIEILEKSGIDFRINPMGTVIEGKWDEVMEIIKRCHDRIREESDRVITNIAIDDRKFVGNRMDKKIKSVENILGHELKK